MVSSDLFATGNIRTPHLHVGGRNADPVRFFSQVIHCLLSDLLLLSCHFDSGLEFLDLFLAFRNSFPAEFAA